MNNFFFFFAASNRYKQIIMPITEISYYVGEVGVGE